MVIIAIFFSSLIYEALPGLWGYSGKGLLFHGNMGTKTILTNREHKKTFFHFLGNRETSQFIFGEQANSNHTWEGLIYIFC